MGKSPFRRSCLFSPAHLRFPAPNTGFKSLYQKQAVLDTDFVGKWCMQINLVMSFVMCSCYPFATYTTTRGDILTFRYVCVLYICDDVPR